MRRLLLASVSLVAACNDTPPPKVLIGNCATTAGSTVVARRVAYGCGQDGAAAPNCINGGATLATSPPGDLRLFVLEQNGVIRILDREALLPTPFLDVSDVIIAGGEQGLLGLAFHPSYATNREFFISYTVAKGGAYADVVARYHASATDPNKAEPTGEIVLSIDDAYSNHNGGMIEFGSDGLLYLGTGDGGSANDPQGNGQNPTALLGKLLRLDVDHPADGKPYGIPAGNPYQAGGGAPEVFLSGVRNPWRWSFDRATGDLWIGDVGQGEIEEVDVLTPTEQPGANLGWNMYEGTSCFRPPCDPAGKTMPRDQRTHADGWTAIIGGQVYRGACYPDLVGWYFYTDNGHGGLAKARRQPDGSLEIVDLPGAFPSSPSSIHADAAGELYETDTRGNVFHLEATP
ncbi:MAG: PQQ-dependent sugar dehydrogenase [Proteobacteria bacterium]|nr:PQQ-dependent sugar dehydrogenase [Pseudomonadota bacterium]